MTLKNKIDFAVIIGVNNANPNGDPLTGNRPRQTADHRGEISDVCLKRKIRNRLLAMGEEIFVQSDDNRVDEYRSLNDRFKAAKFSKDANIREESCKKWLDVRSFGQVFAFGGDDSVSIGIRGPVTIQSAFSLRPIVPHSLQITKSVNLETNKDNPDRKGSDTMGMKHRVDSAIYVAYGAITPQLASKTGLTAEDVEKIKVAIQSLFEGDETSARPDGTMEVLKVIWCNHSSGCGQYSSAHVHRVLRLAIATDGAVNIEKIKTDLPNLFDNIEFLDELEGEALDNLPIIKK